MFALSMHTILGDGKLIGDNFLDPYRNLRIVLMQEKLVVPKSKDKDDVEFSSTFKKYLEDYT